MADVIQFALCDGKVLNCLPITEGLELCGTHVSAQGERFSKPGSSQGAAGLVTGRKWRCWPGLPVRRKLQSLAQPGDCAEGQLSGTAANW